jgi:hypothetical protein
MSDRQRLGLRLYSIYTDAHDEEGSRVTLEVWPEEVTDSECNRWCSIAEEMDRGTRRDVGLAISAALGVAA